MIALILSPFVTVFSWLIALASTSNIMLSSSGESGYSCLTPD